MKVRFLASLLMACLPAYGMEYSLRPAVLGEESDAIFSSAMHPREFLDKADLNDDLRRALADIISGLTYEPSLDPNVLISEIEAEIDHRHAGVQKGLATLKALPQEADSILGQSLEQVLGILTDIGVGRKEKCGFSYNLEFYKRAYLFLDHLFPADCRISTINQQMKINRLTRTFMNQIPQIT